jgi:hypothetical protein
MESVFYGVLIAFISNMCHICLGEKVKYVYVWFRHYQILLAVNMLDRM